LGSAGKIGLPRALLPGNFGTMLATDIDSATASAAAAGGAEKRAYVKRSSRELPAVDLLNHVLSLTSTAGGGRKAIAKLNVEQTRPAPIWTCARDFG